MRKLKRLINWYRKHAGYGRYVIDCRGHPCRVTQVWDEGPYRGSVSLVSIINGSTWGCSFNSCAPLPITKEFAESLKEPWYHWDEYPEINYRKYRDLKK